MHEDRSARRRGPLSLVGLALIAFAGALASCTNMQAGSELGSLIPQLLGIAILAWLIILIV